MHVCFLCDEYPPPTVGGLGTKVRLLAQGLAARGHRVTVVGMYSAAAREMDGPVVVERIRTPPLRFTGYLGRVMLLRAALRRIDAAHPIDVLEGPDLSLAPLERGFPTRKVIRISGGHHFFAVTLGKKPRRWTAWLERESYRRAEYICSGSRFAADVTRDLLKLGPRSIEILPNPVDTERFRPRPDIPEQPGLIVFAGTLCEKKGIRQLIQAMPRIVATVPSAHLQVLGRDMRDRDTGESFEAKLRREVDPAVADRIEFAGPVPNARLPEMFPPAAVCVFPSHMEVFSNVNLEAMAVGRPLVTSRTGPGPELIEDGVHGLFCDPHDPESIADATIRILRDRDLARMLGENARARAEAEFSVPVILGKNERFFERCVNGHVA